MDNDRYDWVDKWIKQVKAFADDGKDLNVNPLEKIATEMGNTDRWKIQGNDDIIYDSSTDINIKNSLWAVINKICRLPFPMETNVDSEIQSLGNDGVFINDIRTLLMADAYDRKHKKNVPCNIRRISQYLNFVRPDWFMIVSQKNNDSYRNVMKCYGYNDSQFWDSLASEIRNSDEQTIRSAIKRYLEYCGSVLTTPLKEIKTTYQTSRGIQKSIDVPNNYAFLEIKYRIAAWKGTIDGSNPQSTTDTHSLSQGELMSLIKHTTALLLNNHNIVLHGAPGTGKTFLAKQTAKAMGAEYEFVQFHPSYDYTDFVEGLRPVKASGTNNVAFERRDGVFKAFCKKALAGAMLELKRELNDNNESELKGLKDSLDKLPESAENLSKSDETHPESEANFKAVLDAMIELLKPNALPDDNDIKKRIKGIIGGEDDDDILSTQKKYIFIIDEINRGNMSKILGELFFSIDPGYRGINGRMKTQYANLVDDNDVFKEGFFVPNNVYIIGTMNDIDRSVECMDFAFRRRFVFKEIKAISGLYDEKSSNDEYQEIDWLKIKLGDAATKAIKVMSALNDAIFNDTVKDNDTDKIKSIKGLNRDYHIGAAYFAKLSKFKNDDGTIDEKSYEKLWNLSLEPLLKEYVRGNRDPEGDLKKLKKAYKNAVNGISPDSISEQSEGSAE